MIAKIYDENNRLKCHLCIASSDIEELVARCGWTVLDDTEQVTPEDQSVIDALNAKGFAESLNQPTLEAWRWWSSRLLGPVNTYDSLCVTSLDPTQHKRTCNYWYCVTNHETAHTAFATARGLYRWMEERGLTLDGELPPLGTWGNVKIVGTYCEMMHNDYAYFDALPAIFETKAMSNGDYTLAKITQDKNGVRTVHRLNPNCKLRPVFDYQSASAEMR